MAESFVVSNNPSPLNYNDAMLQIDALNKEVRDRAADGIRMHGLVCAANVLLQAVLTEGVAALVEGPAVTLLDDIKEISGDTITTPGTAAKIYHKAHKEAHEAKMQVKYTSVASQMHKDAGSLCHKYLKKAVDSGFSFGEEKANGLYTHHEVALKAIEDNKIMFQRKD